MQMEAVLQSGMMFSATDKTNCVLRLMHAKQITHSCSMFRSELTGVVISAKLKICCGDPTGGYKVLFYFKKKNSIELTMVGSG